jgi:ADP-heptose:LPS heptosyltransferase
MICKFINNSIYKLECLRRTARILLANSILPKAVTNLENSKIKVAIFKRGGIGDWIIYSKPLENFKNISPNTEITIYCEKRQLQIVELIGLANKTIEITNNNRRKFLSRHKFLSEIRKENYDIWIDSDISRTNFGDAACLASQAKLRVGYAASQHSPCHRYIEPKLFTHKLEDNLGKMHMHDRFEKLLDIGANLISKNNHPEKENKFSSGLNNYMWNGHKSDYFVIAPGASSKTRIWPVERFAEIITKIINKYHIKPILVGSTDDQSVCQSIEKLLGQTKITNLAGTLDINELFKIISKSRILITNDSGPMHIGRVTMTPTLSIVSGADFESYPNYREKKTYFEIVHSHDQSCFNCQWKCTHADARKKTIKPCLDLVTTEMAWKKINKIFLENNL